MSDEVVKMVVPEPSVPVPRVVVPSLKVTVPVGVPPELVTVAVNVTDWPKTDGFALDVRAVVVLTVEVVLTDVVVLTVGEELTSSSVM